MQTHVGIPERVALLERTVFGYVGEDGNMVEGLVHLVPLARAIRKGVWVAVGFLVLNFLHDWLKLDLATLIGALH